MSTGHLACDTLSRKTVLAHAVAELALARLQVVEFQGVPRAKGSTERGGLLGSVLGSGGAHLGRGCPVVADAHQIWCKRPVGSGGWC